MDTTTRIHHPGHMALRRSRTSVAGQAYLLTTTTLGRRPAFSRPSIADAVATELSESRIWRDNPCHAWVLMPDHMHALLTLGHDESLGHLLRRVKAVCARAAHDVAGGHGQPFWARAFHDRALRRDEDMHAAALYVIANPVRAGLVEHVDAWPWWGSEWVPRSCTDAVLDAPAG